MSSSVKRGMNKGENAFTHSLPENPFSLQGSKKEEIKNWQKISCNHKYGQEMFPLIIILNFFWGSKLLQL